MKFSQQLITSYTSLGEKERKAVNAILLVGIPLLIYLLCLQPLYRFYTGNKQAFTDNRELLQWMQQHKSSVTDSPPSPSAASQKADLIQVVSTEAEKQGVTIDRLQPQGDNKIRIWSQDVAFASLVNWLAALQKQGLVIEATSIDQSNTPGKVSFQGTLLN